MTVQSMKNGIKSDLLKIVVANIVSQGFVLILSGTFWDEWFSYYRDRAASIRSGMAIGRPTSAYWSMAVWNLPNYGYRWLVFFGFLLTSIILYMLLIRSGVFSRAEALYVSILYTVFPINDARVLLATFPYSVGWLSFFIGLYMFMLWWKDKSRKKPLLRVVTLMFFAHSFILNSLLIYYAIILLYIFYMEYSYNRNMFKATAKMLKYVDFILVPFVYFVGKQMLFPTYGRFESYNKVTLSGIFGAACRLPGGVIKQIWAIWSTIFDLFVPHRVNLLCSAVIVLYAVVQIIRYILKNKYIKSICEGIIRNSDVKKIFLGVMLFGLGLYPYVVVRSVSMVRTTGVYSRDSMLLGPGMALILFYCFKLGFKKEINRKIAVYTIIIFSILSCNVHYVNYQKDAYWQEVLIYRLGFNEQIREAENILFLSDDDTGISGTRFYSLNGDASVAYGDQSRLIMHGYSDLYILQSDKRSEWVESGLYLMNDYDINNDKLDGVAVYSCDISFVQCLKLKLLEEFHYTAYREVIENLGVLNYYSVDSPEAIELLGEERYIEN